MKGKFIVFEGIDGSGKTTQINQLYKWLIGTDLIPENNKLVITREPGGTKLGKSIRSLLLDTSREKSPGSITELLLCLLYTSPSPRDRTRSRMPSSA